MKNREKFKDELIEACENETLACFVQNHVAPEYGFNIDSLSWSKRLVLLMLWLDEGYQEPEVDWSEISIDTPVLVKNREDDDWNRRYFAKAIGKKVVTFVDGQTSWTTNGGLIDWMYAKLP